MNTHPPYRTRIKICGITTLETALTAVNAGADAIGLVFAEGSPRRVDERRAYEITSRMPPFVSCVGVFRNPDVAALRDVHLLVELGLHHYQVHGDQDEHELARLRSDLIRGLPFDEQAILRWDRCHLVEALLVDGPSPGSGTPCDHAALASVMPRLSKPVILAGGLTAENVGAAIRTVRPYAVDVSSGVESASGEKDPNLIRAFCEAVRAADLDAA